MESIKLTPSATFIAPLQIRSLRKQYGRNAKSPVEAVCGISFSVQAGECFGLLGPNGAGKSTTINCITGFYPPSSGEVLIEGMNVHQDPKCARQILGVCSQDDTLDTDFNVLDQMVRHATFYRIPMAEGRRRAIALLQRFGLEDRSGDPVETLSGGLRRRLQVARSLISEPRVLVLDEPTTGLDPDARRTLWEILGQCREKGLAILLSTHYMDEAERLCDRIAILHHGKILDVGSPQELIARHIGTAQVEEEVRPGVIWKRPPNLEDVFLKLSGTHLKEGVAE
ncbi:ABC transporter ATP-binding protein [Bdellovibrionota bacterium FG-1]